MLPETITLTDPFADLLGYHLRRLSLLAMADLNETLAPLALKPADASVLFTLAADDGLTQSELGRRLGIQRANMAPLIAALLKRGLIEREQRDGRSQMLRLSAAGQALRQDAWQRTRRHEQRLFGRLQASEKAGIVKHLQGLWQELSEPAA